MVDPFCTTNLSLPSEGMFILRNLCHYQYLYHVASLHLYQQHTDKIKLKVYCISASQLTGPVT